MEDINKFEDFGLSPMMPSLQQCCVVKICSLYIADPEKEVILESIPHLKEQCTNMAKRMKFNSTFLDEFNTNNLISKKSIVWTSYGTINMKETFRKSMQTIDLRNRFNMACYFCLEEEILDIWQNSGGDLNMNGNWLREQVFIEPILVYYWTKFCEGVPTTNEDIENIISHSIRYSLYYAFKYFWPKLSEKQKSDAIKYFSNRELTYLHLLTGETIPFCHHILTVCNKEQLGTLITKHAHTLLLCLSYIYDVDYFYKTFEYFITKKYISLVDALSLTIRFYFCMCKDFHATYHNSLACSYRRDNLFKRSLTLVLNQEMQDDEIMEIFPRLVEYYQEMVIWHLKSDEQTTRIIVMSKIVNRIVNMYENRNPVLLNSYEKAIKSPTIKTLMVFMFQFTLTLRWINMHL